MDWSIAPGYAASTRGFLSSGNEILSRMSEDAFWQKRIRCRPQVVIQFYRELSTMLNSGISLGDALQVAVEYGSDDTMLLVAGEVQKKVTTGHRLSAAMAGFPKVFSPLAVAMVRMGEASGQLTQGLSQLAAWMERDDKIRRQVLSALTYPAFALGLTGVLTLVLFTTVVPGFVEMFEEMNVALPLPTKILVTLTALVTSPLAWSTVSLAALVGLFLLRGFLETDQGKLRLYRFWLSLPLVGRLMKHASMARFASAADAMLRSGTDFLTGIRLAAGASGSPLLAADGEYIKRSLAEGHTLAEHFRSRPELYPPVVVQLTMVGEESAQMPRMLGFMAQHFDQEVRYQIDVLGAVLEPVLMAAVATVVGFTVISIFLPMYGFLGKLGV